MPTLSPALSNIVLVMVCTNVLLMSIHSVLGMIKDKANSNLENEAYAVTGQITGILQSLIDWASGNKPNSPPPTNANPPANS